MVKDSPVLYQSLIIWQGISMTRKGPNRKISDTPEEQVVYLKHQLNLLEKEQSSGQGGPGHQAELIQEKLRLQLQLQLLYQSNPRLNQNKRSA